MVNELTDRTWMGRVLFVAALTNLLAFNPTGPQASALACDGPERAAPDAVDHHKDTLPPGALYRFGTVRFRHAAYVSKVVFSPDGRTLFSAGKDGVRVWESATGKLLRSFDAGHHFASIHVIAVAPDGKTLASARMDDETPIRL